MLPNSYHSLTTSSMMEALCAIVMSFASNLHAHEGRKVERVLLVVVAYINSIKLHNMLDAE